MSYGRRLCGWALAGALGWSLSVGSGAVEGQEGPYAFQIKGGIARPLAAFHDDSRGWEEESRIGATLAMGFTFPLFRSLGGYLGFSQYRFGCDEDVCSKGKEWISTGFDVALRMVLGRNRLRPWIQGGLHTHRMEGWLLGEEARLTSDGGGGFEVGGGVLIGIGERMSLTPGARYGFGEVPFPTRPAMDLRYLVFDVGLVVGF